MIGNNIKKLRILNNLTQKQLAEKSNITRESVGNYERGDRIPPSDILNKIAIALNVSVNDLIGDNPQIEEQELTSEYKTIYVDDLIEQLEKFRGGKVAFVYIGEGNIQIDIDKFKDIRIEEAWGKCPEEDKKDITINIK